VRQSINTFIISLSSTMNTIAMNKMGALVLLLLTYVHAFVVPSTLQGQVARPIITTSSSLASTTTAAVESALPAGLTKTVLQTGNGQTLQRGDIATLQYSCYVVDSPVPFAKSTRQKMIVGDGSMIAGWEAALKGMQIGERAVFRVSDAETLGYGVTGVPPVIPANAELEFDINVLDAQPPTANIDFDNLALDATPTTAADIARAYELRQAGKANTEDAELEGFAGFLRKAQNFYFFGLFEGETGERPPWFLRPSITFPLAFAVVGAAFYVTFAGGGITERGAQTTDELDEFIVSATALAVHALAIVDLGI
jgi:hypothetical protein